MLTIWLGLAFLHQSSPLLLIAVIILHLDLAQGGQANLKLID
jgi:hypothetical protein